MAALPPGVEPKRGRPIAAGGARTCLVLDVDLSMYELASVLRACYKLTDRMYAHLARETPGSVQVAILGKKPGEDLDALAGEMCNELLDQQLRTVLAREAAPLREMIVAQAFAEGNLLDPEREDGDYEGDPRGAGDRR
jgi:His-Xaa-Ser system protein HxsD